MRKTILTALMALMVALSLSFGVMTASADSEIIGQPDTDWQVTGGSPTVVFAEDGYTKIGNLAAFGYIAATKNLCVLDGLKVYLRANTLTDDTCAGFYFASSTASNFNEATLSVTIWKGLWGQTRIAMAKSHDPNATALVYTTPDFTSAGFGVTPQNAVLNNVATYDLCFEFKYIESTNENVESAYEITVSSFASDVMWTNNCNYTTEGLEEGAAAAFKVYAKASLLNPLLNDKGELNVLVGGFPNKNSQPPEIEIKVMDNNYKAYVQTELANANTAVTEYENAVAAIADEETFTTAMEKRTALANALTTLRSYDKANLTAAFNEIDASIKENAQAVNIVKGLVQEDITAANAAFDAFEDETTLNDTSFAAAKALVKKANDNFNDKKTMLPDAECTAISEALTALKGRRNYASVLNWVVGYENEINALNVTSETIGDEIAALKAKKAAFAGSSTEKTLNGLGDEDKAALTARITAADEKLLEKESSAAVAVKEKYLADFESATQEDLTVFANIVAAYNANETLLANVNLTEDDGTQYTRYITALENLEKANEDYLTAAIAAVSETLNNKFASLEAFNSVRAAYKAIKFDYLKEESANYAAITAAYAALTAKIEANVWYDFNAVGISKTERNETGMYFEMTPSFPNRINYNGKLDLSKGAEIVVEFTNIAYFNGDKDESGNSKGANNLCINFLDQKNVYKTTGKGINIIVWMFEMESSVDIVDEKDQSIVRGVLATPVQGGKLTISVKYEQSYYDFAGDETYPAYIVKLNATEIVLPASVAEARGLEISNECYFSLGSFADYKADPNCFTIVSVNGKSFAEEKAPDDSSSGSDDSGNSSSGTSDNTSTGSDTDGKTGCGGCGGNIYDVTSTAAVVLGACFMVFFSVRKKKVQDR